MNKLKRTAFLQLFVLITTVTLNSAAPDPGKWDFVLSQLNTDVGVSKSLFAESQIIVQITCKSFQPKTELLIIWTLTESKCWQNREGNENYKIQSDPINATCEHDGHILLPQFFTKHNENINNKEISKRDSTSPIETKPKSTISRQNLVYVITKDGFYNFKLEITAPNKKEFNATVQLEMKGTYGYLSAEDWPLLPFYGSMCLVYVFLGILWLLVSFMQWRDLLRIQFWIGGVILLGMMEKAMFYAEYQSINYIGTSTTWVVLLAEWVSCSKRTLARMLVIIVSLGFGIVKPRLGPMLHRVVGVGALYFTLAVVESYLRVVNTKYDPTSKILVASIPLAVLDSGICWWIFTSLVQTTRTLRLRRNLVKLSLYRHFTNTLIFAVISSVIFMLYSIKAHRLAQCLTDWKDLWLDDGFWHVLFSFLLLVIMILWRPTNNNQRYAFTPLLDNLEDEDDDDEEDQFVSDAYGVKMRGARSNSPKPTKSGTTEEDDLRWVEENIPTAIADAALPILDSDEEIISTKFEVSKMQ